jgi:hypothetical protein
MHAAMGVGAVSRRRDGERDSALPSRTSALSETMLAAAWLVGLLHGFKVDPEKIRVRFSKLPPIGECCWDGGKATSED